jgi:hypothetical protein
MEGDCVLKCATIVRNFFTPSSPLQLAGSLSNAHIRNQQSRSYVPRGKKTAFRRLEGDDAQRPLLVTPLHCQNEDYSCEQDRCRPTKACSSSWHHRSGTLVLFRCDGMVTGWTSIAQHDCIYALSSMPLGFLIEIISQGPAPDVLAK